MDHFHYREGRLAAEEVPIDSVAEALGTPFYCYAAATMERHFRVFSGAFDDRNSLICYAVKANSNIAVITPDETALERRSEVMSRILLRCALRPPRVRNDRAAW